MPADHVTPEVFARMQDTGGVELLGGRLVDKGCGLECSRVAAVSIGLLCRATDGHDVIGYSGSLGYRCFADADRVRKPSVTLVRGGRVRGLGEHDLDFMPIVPDLAVEVAPRHAPPGSLSARIDDFLSAGFPRLWVLFPEERAVVIHAESGRRRLDAADRVDAGDLLPGWSCRVTELFGE